MISTLLSMMLTCDDAMWIIKGINRSNTSQAIKSELIIETILATEDSCDFSLEREPRR